MPEPREQSPADLYIEFFGSIGMLQQSLGTEGTIEGGNKVAKASRRRG
jgi:hypothetical protein